MGESDPKPAGGADAAEIFKVQQSSSMLERWNDDKMDALAGKVDDLAESMRELRAEIRDERKQTRAELLDLQNAINARFDRMLWAVLGAAATICVAVITASQL
jgi:hypothetical protein